MIPGVDESGRLHLLTAGPTELEIVPLVSTDNERIARVAIDRRPLSRLTDASLDRPALAEAFARSRLLGAASLVGTTERVLELTVDHVRNRVQFGQSLGAYQAVQHKCAEVALHADVARLAVFNALSRAAAGSEAGADCAVACFLAARAAERAVIEGAQLHGGLGFMSEYELSFHFRRAKGAQLRDGGERGQLTDVYRHLDGILGTTWARS
jgi:alkylation response protein AidB-like acyl-CoA dehydrogenase